MSVFCVLVVMFGFALGPWAGVCGLAAVAGVATAWGAAARLCLDRQVSLGVALLGMSALASALALLARLAIELGR